MTTIAPQPSPDWNMVTVKWAGTYLDGSPAQGTLTLSYDGPGPFLDEDVDTGTPLAIFPTQLTLPINEVTRTILDEGGVERSVTVGYAEATIPASNDPDIEGGGGTYSFSENLVGLTGRQSVHFLADMAAPGGIIWLNKLAGTIPDPGETLGVVYYDDFVALTDRVTALENGGGTGGGTGTVTSVNGVDPVAGDVTLAPADIGAATAAQGALADTAVQPADLGSAAASDTTDFDPAGAAAAAQSAAISTSEAYTDDAISGLGGGTGTVTSVNGVDPVSGDVVLTPADIGAATAAQGAEADTAIQPIDLATVATTGSYTDLSNQPAIPDSADDIGAVPTTRTVAGHALSANVALVKGDVGLGNVDNTSDVNKPVSTAQQTALDAKADLVGGLVPTAQIPAIAITEYLGTAANQAAMLALSGQKGDWTVRTDLGTTWIITGTDPTQLASWTALAYPTAPVTSVAGRTGVVVLAKADVGLANVDNTADNVKNVLTATKLFTARNIDGVAFDGTAAITIIAPGTHAATSKTTPVDADEIPMVDSAAGNVLKKLTWANLKATIKTYLDGTGIAKLTTARTINGVAFDGTANIAPRLDQIAAPTADVSLNSHKAINATDPTNPQDVATKNYTDSNITDAMSTVPDTVISAFPGLPTMVLYDDVGAAWPTLDAGLAADATVGWIFIGSDDTDPPPSTTSEKTLWVRPV